jgi:hypothetical protein
MLNHIHQPIQIQRKANHVLLYCCPTTPGKSVSSAISKFFIYSLNFKIYVSKSKRNI